MAAASAGHEWATIGDWTANTPALPQIVSMEVHLNLDPVWHKREYTPPDLALFFGHMASLGYASEFSTHVKTALQLPSVVLRLL